MMILSNTSAMAMRIPTVVQLPTRQAIRRQRMCVVAATNPASTSSPVTVPAKTREQAQAPLSFLTKPAAAAASMAAAFVAFAGPVLAESDQIFQKDFDVSFMGNTIDHKVIIYLIVFGQFVGFVGATVSGLDARRSKEELLEVNTRLIKVNSELRKLAREGQQGMYAKPSTLKAEKEGLSEEEINLREKVVALLKEGRKHLKEKEPKKAETVFTLALSAINDAGNALEHPWKAERKAYRGLGSATMQMGQNQKALDHMFKVLSLCEKNKEEDSVGDALGVIADIYTDLGDMEQAALYYDKYLLMMS